MAKEAGYDLVSSEWWAFTSAGGNATNRVEKISRDVGSALKDTSFQQKMPGEEIIPSTPAELLALLNREAEGLGAASPAKPASNWT